MKNLALLLLLAAHATAATITVDGAGERATRQASGQDAPSGTPVLVGFFAGLGDAQIVAHQYDAPFQAAAWVGFGLGGAVGQGVGGAAGYFTFETVAQVTFLSPAAPNNRIYFWEQGLGEQAIFTSNQPEWTWPTPDDSTSGRTLTPDDNLSMIVGSVDATGTYMAPSVPESSPLLLVTVALGCFAARRRRDTIRGWQDHAASFARDEPAKAVASAFDAGVLPTLLPVGAIVRMVAVILFGLARPVLLGLGLRKAWELCPIEKAPSIHP